MFRRPVFDDMPRHLQLVFQKGRELLQCPAELLYDEVADFIMKGEEKIYKLSGIAEEIGFSERTVQEWRRLNFKGFAGLLHREGRMYCVGREDLKCWLKEAGIIY